MGSNASRAGRDREQAELATALTRTLAGYGRAVLLLGEVGRGKSMLADWLVNMAAAREVLLGVAREAAAAGRADVLARAALALGGGLAGFEVPLQDEEQADLPRCRA